MLTIRKPNGKVVLLSAPAEIEALAHDSAGRLAGRWRVRATVYLGGSADPGFQPAPALAYITLAGDLDRAEAERILAELFIAIGGGRTTFDIRALLNGEEE